MLQYYVSFFVLILYLLVNVSLLLGQRAEAHWDDPVLKELKYSNFFIHAKELKQYFPKF